jgi:hypothetical protein
LPESFPAFQRERHQSRIVSPAKIHQQLVVSNDGTAPRSKIAFIPPIVSIQVSGPDRLPCVECDTVHDARSTKHVDSVCVYYWCATWAGIRIDATCIPRWKISLPELFSGVAMTAEDLFLVTNTMKGNDSNTGDNRASIALAE